MRQSIRRSVSMPVNGAKLSFEIVMKKLFANGEQGFVYDPNDLSTLYQDAAGTVPVTAVGQPVGLILDKSKKMGTGSNVAAGFTSDYIFANSVSEVLSNNPSGAISSNWFPVTPNAFYKIHAPVSNRCRVQVKNASGVITYLTDYSSETSADARLVAALADSVYMRVYFANEHIGSQVTTFEARKLAGNHAHQATSASRPILRKNAVTGANYLEFDGADDFLQTNAIDFTGTDKVTVVAGVNLRVGVPTGCVAEIGVSAQSIDGSFGLFKGPSTLQWASRGTSGVLGAIYNSPVSPDVLTAKAFINGSVLTTRRNSLLVINDTRSQGTGNYGNYPLYIGRRAGTSLPFNGHIYGLIGIGKLASDNETTAIEKELAKRTGVDLNV